MIQQIKLSFSISGITLADIICSIGRCNHRIVFRDVICACGDVIIARAAVEVRGRIRITEAVAVIADVPVAKVQHFRAEAVAGIAQNHVDVFLAKVGFQHILHKRRLLHLGIAAAGRVHDVDRKLSIHIELGDREHVDLARRNALEGNAIRLAKLSHSRLHVFKRFFRVEGIGFLVFLQAAVIGVILALVVKHDAFGKKGVTTEERRVVRFPNRRERDRVDCGEDRLAEILILHRCGQFGVLRCKVKGIPVGRCGFLGKVNVILPVAAADACDFFRAQGDCGHIPALEHFQLRNAV